MLRLAHKVAARSPALADATVLSLAVSAAAQGLAIDAKLNSMMQEQPIEVAASMQHDMRKTPLPPAHMMFSHVRNDLILSAVSHGLAEDGRPFVAPRGPDSARGGVCSCCVQMPCVCKTCS